MKKIILAFGFLAFMLACSTNDKTVAEEVTIDYSNADTDYAIVAEESAAPEVDPNDGQALINSSDCLTCHTVDTKLIGPSYKEVAAKYTQNDIEMLAKKIIDGGSGNWGEIPMSPHPAFDMDKASAMVEYILSLK